MKLLFDHNLSPRLVKRSSDLYPNATHVSLVGLSRESDETIWDYALINDYLIVTKDSDFDDLSMMRGFPPKVIWLRLGNCTTSQVEMLLRVRYDAIRTFAAEPTLAILSLF